MAATARVSYVLVNWKTEGTLSAALQSVQRQTLPPHEVILVNNASPAWDRELLEEFPELDLIELKRNVGFAEGNNLGIRRSSGDIVVLLNCDAELAHDFAEHAVAAFGQFPSVGTIAPKLLGGSIAEPSGRLDSAGHILRTDRTAVSRGRNELDQGQYDQPAWVFGASAAAVAYRRTMLDSITEGKRRDYFDSSFFAYYEDVDLDWRAQLAGWQTLYWPQCVAYHQGHGSGGRASWRIRLRAEKNRYLMLAKNDSIEAQLPNLGALLQYELWHLAQLLKSPVQLLGFLATLRYLPTALAKRCRAQRSVVPHQLAECFLPRGPIPPLTGPIGVQTQPGLVSVVLVNYNGYDLTEAALKGLRHQDYDAIETIVVDNASADDEAARLAAAYPEARLLQMESNIGFSAAVNWGAHIARGEWLVLLNNDAIPDRRCIARLVASQQRTGAWAVSGRLIDLHSPELVAPALAYLNQVEAGTASPEWTLPAELRSALRESYLNHGLSWYGYPVTDAYGARNECFYPSGGLCCFPRSTLTALGSELFRHRYFAYYEDVELGFRIRAAGGWIAKESSAVAVHVASSTARKLGGFRLAYLRERNRLWTLRTWLPTAALWRLGPLMVLQCVAAFVWLLLARPLSAAGFACAHMWCMTNFLALSRDHRQAQGTRLRNGWPLWADQLNGQIRGSGGLANRFALWWARRCRIPVLEDPIPRVQPQDLPAPGAAPAASPAGIVGTPGRQSPPESVY